MVGTLLAAVVTSVSALGSLVAGDLGRSVATFTGDASRVMCPAGDRCTERGLRTGLLL